MIILGISAFYHDSAAAIIEDGEIIAAAQEERFSRKKHDESFPVNAIRFCLEFAGRSINEIDAVAFYDKPFLKFERLIETYYGFAPKGLLSFIKAMPVWLKEKIFLKKIIRDELNKIEKVDKKDLLLLFPEHHLSHAASAFYPSPFESAAILTIDGVGEWATTTLCQGDGKTISVINEMHFPHSLGLLYAAFTYYCGFKVNSGEYKLMGLAPFGNPGSDQVKGFVDTIKTRLIDIKEDGSFFLDQQYFMYATGLRMVNERKWEDLFGISKRQPESSIEQVHCNLALAIQMVTEEIIIKLAKEIKRITKAENLCMAGGVALNSVAVGKLQDEKIFTKIFVQPAAGDAGGAPGAALAAYHIYFGQQRTIPLTQMDGMKGSYLGPEYSDHEVEKMIRRFRAKAEHIRDEDHLLERVSQLISEGNIVGWHQGRMEFGPRALGARSILADARDPAIQKKLNLKIKYRESFRPFAPAVLEENANDYFQLNEPSPYMGLVKQVSLTHQKNTPDDFYERSWSEKLAVKRSDIPAVTHVDFSARIQTVHAETNLRFKKLLLSFRKITDCPVLINTSFNVRGEPIVNTPGEAYRCFMNTGIDFLVINNFLFEKGQQPEWEQGQQASAKPMTD
ncbi:MAG: carbamoyltransferase [Chitinophagales bacterium]